MSMGVWPSHWLLLTYASQRQDARRLACGRGGIVTRLSRPCCNCSTPGSWELLASWAPSCGLCLVVMCSKDIANEADHVSEAPCETPAETKSHVFCRFRSRRFDGMLEQAGRSAYGARSGPL
ncbi:hypothetical protein Micbo1qcDRAFT_160377, partial [Microdochium bolleyi]